jgi:hypothetical protein
LMVGLYCQCMLSQNLAVHLKNATHHETFRFVASSDTANYLEEGSGGHTDDTGSHGSVSTDRDTVI